MAKLDRFLMSTDWSAMFPDSKQQVKPNTNSDHNPIAYTATTGFKKSSIFRCENFWLRSSAFQIFVKETWEGKPIATDTQQLHEKMQYLQSQITSWTANNIGNIKNQINVCRDYIEWYGKVEEIRQTTLLEKRVQAEVKRKYTELAVAEEDLWRRRAKTKWTMEGDRNTRYFHAYASAKKRNNTIEGIEHQRRIHKDQHTKAKIFREFYIDLMGKEEEQNLQIEWSVQIYRQ